MSLSVVIKRVAGTRVVSLRSVIASYYAQAPLWERSADFVAAHDLAAPADGAAGFSVFHDVGFKQSDVDTEVCIPIDDAAVLRGAQDLAGLTIYDVPGLLRVASVTHKGPYKGLVAVYRELFGWLAQHGEVLDGQVREIYHTTKGTTPDFDDDEFVTEILVPLKN